MDKKSNKTHIKKVLPIVTSFLLVFSLFLDPLDVMASVSTPYYVGYTEPEHGGNSGYLVLEFSSGKIATYFWSAFTESVYVNDIESTDTGCSIVISDNKAVITLLTDTNLTSGTDNVKTHYTISHYATSGDYKVLKSGSLVDTNPSYTYDTSATIVGYTYKGNVSLVTNNLTNKNSKPVVVFGDDIVGQYIHDLYSLLSNNEAMLQTYLPKLTQLQILASGSKEQLELLVELSGDIFDELDSAQNYLVTYLPYLQDISSHLAYIEADAESIRTTLNSMLELIRGIYSSTDATQNINEYIVDIFELISQDSELFETYFPKLNDIATSTNQTKEKILDLIALTGDLFDELKASGWYIETYLPYLRDISSHLAYIEVDAEEMRVTLNSLLDLCEMLYERVDTIQDYSVTYLPYLRDISSHLSAIEVDVDSIDENVASIDKRIEALADALLKSANTDKNTTEDFKENSDNQSDALNDLNEQAQAEKIDINSTSSLVDNNLDVNVDSRYGVLLANFTGNSHILTMMLAVASMGLISYVLFGKR